MWNNGKSLMWEHITRCYFQDLDLGLHQLPKLTIEHVYLTSFAKMKVKLAVQILSKSMAEALRRTLPIDEVAETAKFCELLNDFFDCCNVRSLEEYTRKRNILLAPYRNTNDQRFSWLKNTFLQYFIDWKNSVKKRPGFEKNANAQSMMQLSWQTVEGIQISVNSLIECTQYLLGQGMPYVLTERFMQDCLEEYFGHQRQCGRRSDNPDAIQFGYNDRILQIQRNAGHISQGNVSGRKISHESKWNNIREEPLPKKPRQKNKSMNK